MIDTINKYRIENKRKPLGYSKNLSELALKHNIKMKEQNKVFHETPINTRQNLCYARKNYIEKPNLAVDAWYNDKGHRDVLLDPKLEFVGINALIEMDGKNYYINNIYQ